MPCQLTSGRTEPCKDTVGGIKKALFIDYVENPFTLSSGEGTAINASITEVFQYELRADTNTFTESIVSDSNTGNTINTQTVEIRLKKQDAATSNQIKLMANGRPIIVLVGYDGSYKVSGYSEGMDITGSTIQSGGAKADFNGYDLTFSSIETDFAPYLDASTITALEALVSNTNIAA
jgi:hypothetical protein